MCLIELTGLRKVLIYKTSGYVEQYTGTVLFQYALK